MTTLAQRLSDIEVLDEHGQGVRIASAWSERPAVVVFIRHFG